MKTIQLRAYKMFKRAWLIYSFEYEEEEEYVTIVFKEPRFLNGGDRAVEIVYGEISNDYQL